MSYIHHSRRTHQASTTARKGRKKHLCKQPKKSKLGKLKLQGHCGACSNRCAQAKIRKCP